MYRKCTPLSLTLTAIFTALCFLVPADHAKAMPKAGSTQSAPTISGSVVETMNASGYTYMLVETVTGKGWVAIPESAVKKGAAVTYFQGMAMKDFTSKTLNRTFDSIIFSPGLADGPAAKAPAPTPVQDDSFAAAVQAEQSATRDVTPPLAPSGGSSGAVVPLEEINIEKSTAANGYTIEEVFTRAKELDGKKVQVRAKVVKFSPLIMGRNWIHLQDGTGNPMHNSHDLVVTSSETLEVESIVVMEGTLAAEKDFGAGYTYSAIIEDAVVVQ